MQEKPQLLTRAQIREVQDVQYEYVEVPEWGGTVKVRSLEGTERDKIEASMIVLKRDPKGKVIGRSQNLANLRAKVIAASIVDEDDNLVFSQQDVEWLGKKNAAALQTVFVVCQRLSKLSDEEVEELVTDLGNGQNGAGGSD